MLQALKKVLSRLGVDRAIFYISVSRVIQGLGGLVTIFLIASFLTIEEQGFYYTFASILAIQIFFELGLGGIITQFVAHEMVNLSIRNSNQIEGNPENLSRLSSLFDFCFKWYLVLSGILLIVLLLIGSYFFTKYGGGNPMVKWQVPWILIALGGSLNLLISPWMAVLQGMNKVKEMARISLIHQLTVMVITWFSLLLGAKLFVPAINMLAGFVILMFLFIRTEYPLLLLNIYRQKINERISYQREIFPYQWRLALSWISGYFIFQLFNPVIFAFSGPVAAGQMGMTLAILNAILSLVLAWTTTKIPIWSSYIATNDYSTLDQSFKKVLRNSTVVSILCIILFNIFIVGIDHYQLPLAARFLPLWLCLVLSITIPINNIINSWATYLRCHKKEPFLIQAIIIGFLCTVSTVLTARYIGVAGVVVGYTAIVVFASTPLSYSIFIRKQRLYHA